MLQILKNATRLFPQIANLPSDDTQDSQSHELFCYFTPFWKDYVYPCFYLAQPLMYMTSKMKFITKSDNKSRTRYPGPSPGIPSTFPPSASPFPFPQTFTHFLSLFSTLSRQYPPWNLYLPHSRWTHPRSISAQN